MAGHYPRFFPFMTARTVPAFTAQGSPIHEPLACYVALSRTAAGRLEKCADNAQSSAWAWNPLA